MESFILSKSQPEKEYFTNLIGTKFIITCEDKYKSCIRITACNSSGDSSGYILNASEKFFDLGRDFYNVKSPSFIKFELTNFHIDMEVQITITPQ